MANFSVRPSKISILIMKTIKLILMSEYIWANTNYSCIVVFISIMLLSNYMKAYHNQIKNIYDVVSGLITDITQQLSKQDGSCSRDCQQVSFEMPDEKIRSKNIIYLHHNL